MSFAAIAPLMTAVAAAQTTQPADWIRQLSDEDWRKREAAQSALIELGDDAIPALSATTQQAVDEEARSRAAAAMAQIEEDRAIGPSRITLHFHDTPLQQAFTELSHQAHAPLEPVTPMMWQQLPQASVSLDVDRMPFWSAMLALSEHTNIWLQQWGNGLRLNNGGPLIAGPRCVSGPLLIVADSLERSQSITFASNPAHSDLFTFRALVMAEPKLHVLRADSSLHLTEAIDERGNSLLPLQAEPHGDGSSVDAAAWNSTAGLQFPTQNPGTRIQSLRGTVGLTLVSKSQRIRFKLPPERSPTIVHSPGGTVALLNAVKLPSGRLEYTIQIVTAAESSEPPEWAGQLARGNAISLYDAGEHAFAHESSQFSGDGRTFNLTLRFNAAVGENGGPVGEPDHLAGDITIASKEIAVPFSFCDLPMP